MKGIYYILVVFSFIVLVVGGCGRKRDIQSEQMEEISSLGLEDYSVEGGSGVEELSEACYAGEDFEGERVVRRLSEEVWHFWRGGFGVSVGRLSALKYMQGGWRSTWLAGKCFGDEDSEGILWLKGRCVSWNEGSQASLRFVLPAEQGREGKKWVLSVRLRPKINPRMDISVNDAGLLQKVDLKLGWQRVDILVDDKVFRWGGENVVRFGFAGSYFEGADRVAARFDAVSLRPYEKGESYQQSVEARFYDGQVPVIEDARILDASYASFGLMRGDEMSAYFVVEKGDFLRYEVGPGPWLQGEANYAVKVHRDGKSDVVLKSGLLRGGDCWRSERLDLGEFVGEAVRLSVVMEGDFEEVEEERALFYFSNPRIVEEVGDYRGGRLKGKYDRVVVIVVDGLRADVLYQEDKEDAGGEKRGGAYFRELASKGVYGVLMGESSGGLVSTVSLLYGVGSRKHGVMDTQSHVKESLVSLGERFGEAGWKRIFMSNNRFIDPKLGYAQGFEKVRNLAEEEKGSSSAVLLKESLEAIKSSEVPVFAYLHLSELRLPFSASEAYLSKFGVQGYSGVVNVESMMNPASLVNLGSQDLKQLVASYEGEVAKVESSLASFISELGGKSLVVIVGSHGTSLGEDSLIGYGNGLSPAELFVPFIVSSSEAEIGEGINGLGRMSDMYATVLDAVGSSYEGSDGHSFLNGRRASGKVRSESSTHIATGSGGYFYLLRGGDRDMLTLWRWGDLGSKEDVKGKEAIAHRAMRDLL